MQLSYQDAKNLDDFNLDFALLNLAEKINDNLFFRDKSLAFRQSTYKQLLFQNKYLI